MQVGGAGITVCFSTLKQLIGATTKGVKESTDGYKIRWKIDLCNQSLFFTVTIYQLQSEARLVNHLIFAQGFIPPLPLHPLSLLMIDI